jgi:hypothetical protein
MTNSNIAIRIGIRYLTLDPDEKMRFEFNNSVFASDVIKPNKSFFFNVPDDPEGNNRIIFNDSNFIEVSKVKIYSAALYILGLPFCKGRLILKGTSDSEFRIAFVAQGFSQNFKDSKLPTLDLGSYEIPGLDTDAIVTHVNARVASSYPDVNHNYPMIWNKEFYGDLNPAFLNFVNNFVDGVFKKNSVIVDNTVLSPSDNLYNLVPFAYLGFILEQLFDLEDYEVIGRLLTDPDLTQLLIYSNTELASIESKHYLNATDPNSTSGSWDLITGKKLTFTTYTKGSLFTFNGTSIEFNTIGLYTIELKLTITGGAPGTYKVHVYDPDSNTTIAYWEGDADSDPEEVILTATYFHEGSPAPWAQVYIEDPLSISAADLKIINISQQALNRYSKYIDYNKLVPDITVSALLKSLRDGLGVVMFYDSAIKKVQFEMLADVITNNNAIDLSSRLVPGHEINFELVSKYIFNYKLQNDYIDYSPYNNIGQYDNLTDLPIPNDIDLVAECIQENKIYIVKEENGLLYWSPLTDIYPDMEAGSGESEVTINADLIPLPVAIANDRLPGKKHAFDILVAECHEKGTSPIYPTGKNHTDLKLLVWRGKVQDLQGDYYPLASPVELDMNNNSLGGIELITSSAHSIYELYIKPWLEFLSDSEEITKYGNSDFDLTAMLDVVYTMQPQNVTTANQVRKIYSDGINFICKQMSVEISLQNGIENVELKLVKKATE